MSLSSEIIISNQNHPGDSVDTTHTGSKFKGDGYYGHSDGLHTVQYNVSGFLGSITMQASLAVDPSESDWFTLPTTLHQSSNLTDDVEATGSHIKNFTGNYVWVRAVISDWTDGSVNGILLNH